jgi:hypothetical protein
MPAILESEEENEPERSREQYIPSEFNAQLPVSVLCGITADEALQFDLSTVACRAMRTSQGGGGDDFLAA